MGYPEKVNSPNNNETEAKDQINAHEESDQNFLAVMREFNNLSSAQIEEKVNKYMEHRYGERPTNANPDQSVYDLKRDALIAEVSGQMDAGQVRFDRLSSEDQEKVLHGEKNLGPKPKPKNEADEFFEGNNDGDLAA